MGDIIIQAAIFAILSSIYIASGLRILTAKRPFIVSQWRQIILGFAPSMATLIYVVWPRYPGESLMPSFLALGGLTIAWGITLSRGYRVIGASRIVLSDALGHALRKMNLPNEEFAQAYRLPTLNNELLVEATAIDWLFNFRLKRFGDRGMLRQLAAEIDEFFRNAPARINRRFGYALVVLGAVILLFGSLLTYKRSLLEAEMRSMREAHQNFFKSSEK